ncbi:cation:proton antiporter [Cytophaga aurantiaca]|uniref:cation:proton antiporter n=1 Tax=Cytophaga aurantiaca TaxID=29530 RepID=UPI00036CA609|nr:cation:proton antiporter [Cytophaga aurantiaca]
MKKIKNSIFYVSVISIFSVLMYWTVILGAALEKDRNIIIPQSGKSQFEEFLTAMLHNLQHPLAILLAQIITIIIIARILGWFCKKIGQPSVVGEIIAGIILGPSLIGMYFPEFSEALFPAKSLGNLQFLSQIGLILFMFIVGMELDLKVLRNKAHEAVVISHASIIIPFALGMGLAFFIYESFAPEGIQFLSFALFLGIAMSITAFPVLARIVQERGIHKTRLGTVVITCAAADDITAWCILAAVIAIVKAGSFLSAFYIIGLALAYVIMMIYVIKPFLSRVGELHATRENLSKPIVAIFLLILLLSSYATEIIGIHALFGAFMAGAVMPENIRFRNIFIEKVEDVALVLLLPLFFVFTGLRTQIGLLNDPYLWKITGLIILVAVAGKFIGSALAAKFVGQNWKNSLTIGALMNTRGLMELVVLNIGYDLGVLTPEVFTMMVIMALLTTFMTGPALSFINYIFKPKIVEVPEVMKGISKYKILLSFGTTETGKTLLKLANGLTKKSNTTTSLTVMHLSQTNELHHYNLEEYEKEIFDPILEESKQLNQEVDTLFKASNDINYDIADLANKGEYDLLLVGLSESIFQGSLLGKVLGFTTRMINPEKLLNTVTGKEKLFENSPFDETTKLILTRTHISVGILIDKNLTKTERIFIPVFDVTDTYLFDYAQKFIYNSGAQVVVLDAAGEIKNNSETKEKISKIEKDAPNHITLQNQRVIGKAFLQQQDIMIISLNSWKKLVETKSVWLSDIPSTLIISEKQSK